MARKLFSQNSKHFMYAFIVLKIKNDNHIIPKKEDTLPPQALKGMLIDFLNIFKDDETFLQAEIKKVSELYSNYIVRFLEDFDKVDVHGIDSNNQRLLSFITNQRNHVFNDKDGEIYSKIIHRFKEINSAASMSCEENVQEIALLMHHINATEAIFYNFNRITDDVLSHNIQLIEKLPEHQYPL